jgi:hypothetical protein
MIKNLVKKFFFHINNYFLRELYKPEYLKMIERAHKNGYRYHQNAVKMSHELLDWVLKDNYLD